MIKLYFNSNIDKTSGSIIIIPTIQVWWNIWRSEKTFAVDINFLFWDIGIRYDSKVI